MQTLQRAAAVFCIACISAELVALLAGAARTARCIKALAGLYILAVLLSQLPGIPKAIHAAMPTNSVSQSASQWKWAGTELLSQTEKQLETLCVEQCRQQFGVTIQASIRLETVGQEVSVCQAVVAFPKDCGNSTRQAVLEYLEQELGVVPTTAEEVSP